MNLMIDKREQEKPDDNSPTFPQEPPPNTSEGQPLQPKDIKKIKRELKGKKAVPTGLFYFIIIPLIILSLVVVYLYYFKRDLLFKPKLNIPPVVQVQQTPVADSTAMLLGQTPGPDSTLSTANQVQPQVSEPGQTTTPPVTPPTQVVRTVPGTNVTAQIMNTLVNSIPIDMIISTLYLDENTFSMEVKANSQTGIDKVYTSLKSALPANTSITSEPKIVGGNCIIAGTYSLPAAQPKPASAKANDAATLSAEISALITKNNTKKLELSIESARAWNNKMRAPVFIKVEGSVSNCQKLVNEILQSDRDYQVSKVILMPSSLQSSVLVIRVFLVYPA
ncbi:MAG TPA: hypothetical protein PLP19_03655 [bacterium]|nr:hypothetical protein [bacterium]HPN42563.1 hypothetical protein [bacterium]